MDNLISGEMVERIDDAGIIAVLVIEEASKAVKLARTLLNSGISAMELTLRTDAALEALNLITGEVPEMLAGAGTVLTTEQISEVKKGGADFAVAPGYNPDVLDASIKAGLPFAPGIATPSEIEGAVSRGCRILKFFHAEGMGGLSYLKGINTPYKFLNIRYIPLGGLNKGNMRSYLEAPEVIAIGGSWLAPSKMIADNDWDGIARNADEAVKILREVRG